MRGFILMREFSFWDCGVTFGLALHWVIRCLHYGMRWVSLDTWLVRTGLGMHTDTEMGHYWLVNYAWRFARYFPYFFFALWSTEHSANTHCIGFYLRLASADLSSDCWSSDAEMVRSIVRWLFLILWSLKFGAVVGGRWTALISSRDCYTELLQDSHEDVSRISSWYGSRRSWMHKWRAVE